MASWQAGHSVARVNGWKTGIMSSMEIDQASKVSSENWASRLVTECGQQGHRVLHQWLLAVVGAALIDSSQQLRLDLIHAISYPTPSHTSRLREHVADMGQNRHDACSIGLILVQLWPIMAHQEGTPQQPRFQHSTLFFPVIWRDSHYHNKTVLSL